MGWLLSWSKRESESLLNHEKELSRLLNEIKQVESMRVARLSPNVETDSGIYSICRDYESFYIMELTADYRRSVGPFSADKLRELSDLIHIILAKK
jgi:hypothetical protein